MALNIDAPTIEQNKTKRTQMMNFINGNKGEWGQPHIWMALNTVIWTFSMIYRRLFHFVWLPRASFFACCRRQRYHTTHIPNIWTSAKNIHKFYGNFTIFPLPTAARADFLRSATVWQIEEKIWTWRNRINISRFKFITVMWNLIRCDWKSKWVQPKKANCW